MNPRCPICLGVGWVCENHPDLPWSDELRCQCGSGPEDDADTSEAFDGDPKRGELSRYPHQLVPLLPCDRLL
jgi:hypothetical protein